MKKANHRCLPSIEELKEILLRQAALDIIMVDEEDSWLRVTSYYKNYSKGVDMVKIDNGAGDNIFILFSEDGAIIKGFDHESILSPYANDDEEIAPGIYDSVPSQLISLLDDDDIEKNDVTFCVWREQKDTQWHKGDVIVPEEYTTNDDGEDFLLGYIFSDANEWIDWAKNYYGEQGEKIKINSVMKLYNGDNITQVIIKDINDKVDIKSVYKELGQIDFITTIE